MFFESLVLLAFILGAVPKVELSFFQPIGDAGMANILKGAYQTLFAILGIEILLVIYPMVQRKNEIVKAGLTAVAIISGIYLLVVFVVLGLFGPNAAEKLRFGLMVLLKTYNAPVIERLNSSLSFFGFLWPFGQWPICFLPDAILLKKY
ncbi:hypothetical protein N752_18255 [Desulforamulus aquiferis]|nr:hypothetical protein N752_18255 [Desulforamulus aquiferis]